MKPRIHIQSYNVSILIILDGVISFYRSASFLFLSQKRRHRPRNNEQEETVKDPRNLIEKKGKLICNQRKPEMDLTAAITWLLSRKKKHYLKTVKRITLNEDARKLIEARRKLLGNQRKPGMVLTAVIIGNWSLVTKEETLS